MIYCFRNTARAGLHQGPSTNDLTRAQRQTYGLRLKRQNSIPPRPPPDSYAKQRELDQKLAHKYPMHRFSHLETPNSGPSSIRLRPRVLAHPSLPHPLILSNPIQKSSTNIPHPTTFLTHLPLPRSLSRRVPPGSVVFFLPWSSLNSHRPLAAEYIRASQ